MDGKSALGRHRTFINWRISVRSLRGFSFYAASYPLCTQARFVLRYVHSSVGVTTANSICNVKACSGNPGSLLIYRQNFGMYNSTDHCSGKRVQQLKKT